jgi:nucleoside-diphosphate-sugar epimerase
VFVSSIAAQSGSYADHELAEDDFPTPHNAYGRSKFAAEQAIRAAGISFTILRPVVISGEGEKGNFAAIHRLSHLPIPLPFGSLTAQRSVLSIQNFNSAIEIALSSPLAIKETFIVSDPKPVTVADLITRYRVGMGRSPWLIPVPENWIRAALKATGQIAIWERIGQPLVAPPTKLLAIGWKPS